MALTSLRALPAWKLSNQEAHNHGGEPEDQMCFDRCGHNAVCVKEELLIWGGYYDRAYRSRYCDNKILWSYNLDLDSWYQVYTSGEIPLYRSGASSVLVWPLWYILCGHTHYGDVNEVYTLNLVTLEWDRIPLPRTGDEAVSPRDKTCAWVYEDRIYVYGGYGDHPYNYLWNKEEDTFTLEFEHDRGWNDQVVYLELNQKCWVRPKCKGDKPLSRAAHATVCLNGKVYVFGGRHRNQRMNDLHTLNLENHTWSGRLYCSGNLPEGRTWHTFCRASKKELLMYGGFNSEQKPLDDAWLLNVETLSWTVLSTSTGLPRLWHTVSTNMHGDILVFGGCENNILADESEMITSRNVILFRTSPFSLERLTLHCLYKHRSALQTLWSYLPKQFQEWLLRKEQSDSVPLLNTHTVAFGAGPNPSQLCMR